MKLKSIIEAEAVKSMENGKQTHHSTPHVTRLDDLEVILHNLRGQQNLTQPGTINKVQGVETALGNRLSQQSLVHESSTKRTDEDAASSLESRRGFFRSSPIFSSLFQSQKKDSQLHSNASGLQGKPGKEQQRRKQLTDSTWKQLKGENKPSSKDEKACKNGGNKPIKDGKACKNGKSRPNTDEKACKKEKKKRMPRNWLPQLLGC